VTGAWPWLAVALLGAYHGVDPSMGWLFAVALGLQEHSRRKVVAALFPIAAGHLVSIALVVGLIAGAMAGAWSWLRPFGAAALILFGVFRFIWPRAHPRWVAMRVNAAELGLWSFLMASAHGAGLMLIPALQPLCSAAQPATQVTFGAPVALAALGVHSAAMLATIAAVSLIVYNWTGVDFLRRGWINVDLIWVAVLATCGVILLVV